MISAGDYSSRVVCRFSHGAASAVATKLALARYGARAVVTLSDTRSEHPDNLRFREECEDWFGCGVFVLASNAYVDTWDVWERERFIASHAGAPCTGLLKRAPFHDFSRPGDLLVFGYTADRRDVERAEALRRQNFELKLWFPLIEAGLTKSDCLAIVSRAGIRLPAMYALGYENNNCIGCPKGGMGYWNKIRRDFPETFERMAALQRKLGPGSAFFNAPEGRLTLDQLHPERGNYRDEPKVECSLHCVMAEAAIEQSAQATV